MVPGGVIALLCMRHLAEREQAFPSLAGFGTAHAQLNGRLAPIFFTGTVARNARLRAT